MEYKSPVELMDEKVKEIILENIKLATQPEIPIMQLVEKQEKLIEQFVDFGYTREQFFEFSRNLVFHFNQ